MKPILLVQFRTDQTEAHEVSCFRDELATKDIVINVVNAVKQKLPTNLSLYSGIILGGSGEFYLSEGHGAGTWREATFEFIHRAKEQNIPLLGICFGFQLLGMAHGAVIVRDEAMKETGTLLVTLYEEGKKEELFLQTPETFLAQFAHKDSLVEFPSHLLPLAKSDRVSVEAFRVQGTEQWGFLFHPELDPERMRARLMMLSGYAGDNSVDALARSFQESPHASLLLHAFVDFIHRKEEQVVLFSETTLSV